MWQDVAHDPSIIARTARSSRSTQFTRARDGFNPPRSQEFRTGLSPLLLAFLEQEDRVERTASIPENSSYGHAVFKCKDRFDRSYYDPSANGFTIRNWIFWSNPGKLQNWNTSEMATLGFGAWSFGLYDVGTNVGTKAE